MGNQKFIGIAGGGSRIQVILIDYQFGRAAKSAKLGERFQAPIKSMKRALAASREYSFS